MKSIARKRQAYLQERKAREKALQERSCRSLSTIVEGEPKSYRKGHGRPKSLDSHSSHLQDLVQWRRGTASNGTPAVILGYFLVLLAGTLPIVLDYLRRSQQQQQLLQLDEEEQTGVAEILGEQLFGLDQINATTAVLRDGVVHDGGGGVPLQTAAWMVASLPAAITLSSSSSSSSTTTATVTDDVRHSVIPVAHYVLAGAIGAMTSCLLTFPLDTIKIRMQVRASSRGVVRRLTTSSSYLENLASLYKGVIGAAVGQAFIKASVFFMLRLCLMFFVKARMVGGFPFTDFVEEGGLTELAVASFICGVAISFVTCPIDRVKVAIQLAEDGTYTGSWNCLKCLWKEDGFVRGVYKGFIATVVREAPSYVVYFLMYEVLRSGIPTNSGDGGSGGGACFNVGGGNAHEGDFGSSSGGGGGQEYWLPPLPSYIAGGLAGVGCWLSIYPIDVVKSRVQSQHGLKVIDEDYDEDEASDDEAKNKAASRRGGGGGGMISSAMAIYKEHGWRGFYKGVFAVVARALINHACSFTVHEAVMTWLASR